MFGAYRLQPCMMLCSLVYRRKHDMKLKLIGNNSTPKTKIHTAFCLVLCCSLVPTFLPIPFSITSLVVRQPYDWLNANGAFLWQRYNWIYGNKLYQTLGTDEIKITTQTKSNDVPIYNFIVNCIDICYIIMCNHCHVWMIIKWKYKSRSVQPYFQSIFATDCSSSPGKQ